MTETGRKEGREPITLATYFNNETGLQNPTIERILQYFNENRDVIKELGENNCGYQRLYNLLSNIIKIHEQCNTVKNDIQQLSKTNEQYQEDIVYRKEKIQALKKIALQSFKLKTQLAQQLQEDISQDHAIAKIPFLAYLQQKSPHKTAYKELFLKILNTNDGSLKGLIQSLQDTFQIIHDIQNGTSYPVTNVTLEQDTDTEQDVPLCNSNLAGWQITYCDENGTTLKLDTSGMLKTKGQNFTLNGLTKEECNMLHEQGENIISNLETKKNQTQSQLLSQQSKLKDFNKQLDATRKSFFETDISLDFITETLKKNNIPEKTIKGIIQILQEQGSISDNDLHQTLRINYTQKICEILKQHNVLKE